MGMAAPTFRCRISSLKHLDHDILTAGQKFAVRNAPTHLLLAKLKAKGASEQQDAENSYRFE